jgi:hypothetical protein
MRMKTKRRKRLVSVLEHLLVLAIAVANYYLVPVTGQFGDLSGVLFVVVLIVLIALVGAQIVRQARAGSDPSVRIRSLLVLLYPIIVVFALSYYVMQVRDPQQFANLTSRTDSLYYTVVTLGTVGYGDVHPVGELAKIVTMVQIVFDLVVIGLLLSIAAARVMGLANTRVQDAVEDAVQDAMQDAMQNPANGISHAGNDGDDPAGVSRRRS